MGAISLGLGKGTGEKVKEGDRGVCGELRASTFELLFVGSGFWGNASDLSLRGSILFTFSCGLNVDGVWDWYEL